MSDLDTKGLSCRVDGCALLGAVLYFIMTLENSIQSLIDWGKKNQPNFNENSLTDGYHSFDELYEFRKLYNAALFNEWGANFSDPQAPENRNPAPRYDVHKSIRHHDGELCFGGGWFIVVAVLPGGQISNHYKMKDWDLFKVPSYSKAKYEFDGHTPNDVVDRLREVVEAGPHEPYG